MNYGEIVKKYREDKKLSQKDLADKVCVDQSMISQIERGTKSITLQLAAEIAKIFDKDLSMFME